MKKELIIERCKKCGGTVHIISDCDCNESGIKCCDETMERLVPNSVDAAIEKHVPTVEINGNKIKVTINHVMEEEHYIEWIAIVTDSKTCMKYLKPGESAEVEFKYVPDSKVYSYCNKHGLWMKEI